MLSLNSIKLLNNLIKSPNFRHLIKSNADRHFTRRLFKGEHVKTEKIGPLGWLLLTIPASTFALGTWQVQRKKWKEDLIVKLHNLTNLDPVELPENLDDLDKMEYQPVHVHGQFLHDKEIYLGPRSLLIKGDAAAQSSLISTSTIRAQGYLVVTPFKLANREETILVNRGWVPHKHKFPATRQKGQVSGDVHLIGIVRLTEKRQQFTPQNNEDANQWFYRDLAQMAQVTGALPIFLDATRDFDVADGPIGGQTRVSLRNEHLSYILTWYGLCAGTGFLWYKQFFKK